MSNTRFPLLISFKRMDNCVFGVGLCWACTENKATRIANAAISRKQSEARNDLKTAGLRVDCSQSPIFPPSWFQGERILERVSKLPSGAGVHST